MNSIRPAMLLALVSCLLQAQPLVNREVLAKIPLADAIVLDPVGPWELDCLDGIPNLTLVAGLDQEAGYPRIVVPDPGKTAQWSRSLAVPVDSCRYPILVVTYRASGVLPNDGVVLGIGRRDQGVVGVLYGRALTADAAVHEAVVDLRPKINAADERFVSVLIRVACRGPEPAVFELLGLRFESDHQLPPLESLEETEVAVRVLDPEGKPVVGATVTADPDFLNTARRANTDAEGRATLRVGNTIDGAHSVRGTKLGMATVEMVPDEKGHLGETMVMHPGCRYGGTVRNEAGAPVARASVQVYTGLPAPNCLHAWEVSGTLTDGDGRWTTAVLPGLGDRLYVNLDHPDYLPQSVDRPPLAEMREGRGELVLCQGGRLSVRVRDPDGHPVSGANVSRGNPFLTSLDATARTDPDGRAGFPERLLDEVGVLVRAEGFAPFRTSAAMGPHTSELDISLAPGGIIHGRVVDCAGTPLPGVQVTVRQWQWLLHPLWSGTTDDAGRFVWRSAPRDSVLVEIGKRGYLSLEDYPLWARKEEHTIVLPPPLLVQGRVTDAETGQPVPGCSVVPGYVPDGGDPWGDAVPTWRPAQAQKTAEGNYRLTLDQRPGRVALVLRAEASGYLSSRSHTLRFDGSEPVCDFQLRKGPGIVGTVRLPNGQPAEGAKVFLVETGQKLIVSDGQERDGTAVRTLSTGPDGHYAFPTTAGRWHLFALHPVGCREWSETEWATSPDLRLQPWGRVEGTYRIGGEPAAGAFVEYRAAVASPFPEPPWLVHDLWVVADSQGGFVLPRVPAGKVRIEGTHRGASRENMVVVSPEPFELPPGGRVRVDLDGTGRPVVGRIDPQLADAMWDAWEVRAGWLTTSVRTDPPRPAEPVFVQGLPSGETEMRLRDWFGTVEGKVYADAYKRYRLAYDEALAKLPQRRYYVLIAADGTFRIDHVPAGHYELEIPLRSPAASTPRAESARRIRRAFSVPEMPGGRSHEPLDLGALQAVAP